MANEPRARSGCAIAFVISIAAVFIYLAAIAMGGSDRPAPRTVSIQPGKVNQAALDDLTAHAWTYSRDPDKMTSKPDVEAATTSANAVQFPPPYDGGAVGRLTIRKHPRFGTDVVFSVNTGQIVCDVSDGCPVLVRFDKGQPKRFIGRVPSDYDSKVLFLTGAPNLISRLKRSKAALVEVQFYQSGGAQFAFNTQGLHWPPKESDY